MISKLKLLLHPFKVVADIINAGCMRTELLLRRNRFEREASLLTNLVLSSKEPGVSSNRICKEEVIISLTSYGKRINDVYLAIESIMRGSLKPNRIILWLNEPDFTEKKLPITLKLQKERGLEIRPCKDIRSYKKLLYTLKDYPEACIITIDDDAIYNFDFLENLIKSHNENPFYIYANRVHRIKKNLDGSIKRYQDWGWTVPKEESIKNDLFFTGIGGVLYPPHSLNEEVFNEDVFSEICPTADDIWFNAMARLKGTKIEKSFTHVANGEDYILNETVQDCALSLINNAAENSSNDIQIKAVFEKYRIKI